MIYNLLKNMFIKWRNFRITKTLRLLMATLSIFIIYTIAFYEEKSEEGDEYKSLVIKLPFRQIQNTTWEKYPNPSQIVQNEGTISSTGIREEVEKRGGSCNFPPLTNAEQFFQYRKKEKHCKNLVVFGGKEKMINGLKYNDGEKFVCMDEEYTMKPGNCIVLSFGIFDDWSFDDAMDKFGCKVFSFDPTIGLEDHNRSANIQFFSLGLSDTKKKTNLTYLSKEKFPVDRYQSILQKLNLSDSIIDYLKVDIEGNEIDFFNDVFKTSPQLLSNVRQIGMELHPGRVSEVEENLSNTSSLIPLWNGMQQLECMGFKLLTYKKNMDQNNRYRWRLRKESTCYEALWGKIQNSSSTMEGFATSY